MTNSHYFDSVSVTEAFKKGKFDTKLSFLIMGFSNLYHKQIIKGCLFLLSEILFLITFFSQIIPNLQGLITLGTHQQGLVEQTVNGIKMKVAVDGDNSMLMLIFGLASLIFCLVFAYIYWCNLPPKSLFDWVGLANFGNIFNGRMAGTFFPVLSWTLIWAVFATVTNFFFGIVLALIINTKGLKLKKMWRTIFVITIAVPQFISLLIMRNLLSDAGPVNAFLEKVGLISAANPLPFLSDPLWAKFSIIIVNMWVGIPVTMLVASGIIMNLPQEQIEAAEIDGANKFQIFKSITFPQILLVMMPNLIQQFIGNINNFNVIYLLTGGGPTNSNFYQAGSTDLLVTWLYNLTVTAADYNLASVIGILIFVLSAVFSLLAYTRTNSYKEGVAK